MISPVSFKNKKYIEYKYEKRNNSNNIINNYFDDLRNIVYY